MKININLTEKEQVLQTIRDNPGITTRQIKTLLPHMDPKAIEKHTRRMSDIYAFVPDHDPNDVILSVRRLSGWKIKKHSRDTKTGATIWMALRSG